MSIRKICSMYGISRQGYYKLKNKEERDKSIRRKIIMMLQMKRRHHPKMGIKKILYLMKEMIEQEGIKIGRDKVFKIAREEGYLIRKRRRGKKTTKSSRIKYKNHIKDLVVERINQVWVSDITYIRIGVRRFAYLFIVMDLYSRNIIGYRFGYSLETRWGVEALESAIKRAGRKVEGVIHHSDHGIQYMSKEYTELIEKSGMILSMGEIGNAYDNAYAERVIGILKSEYGLGESFLNYELAREAIRESISLYNNERPRLSLNYATPEEVYENVRSAPPVRIKNNLALGG